MNRNWNLFVVVFALFSTSYTHSGAAPAVLDSESLCIAAQNDIVDKLNCLTGMTAKETTDKSTPVGARQFELTIHQPLDHQNPGVNEFSQRLALIHRGENEPMVLQTSGYSIFGVRETSIARMFATNQVQVEHRFFADSKPSLLDWSKLDIRQSADDFHQVTIKLKKIYTGPWVNTGGSKGGMTSIYHRRFYPDDLVGTVADVAPMSYTRADQRYNEFLNQVGGEEYKSCRDNFKKLQIDILKNRNQFLPQITGNFSQLGSANVALEHATIESVFYFWQYGNPEDPTMGCNALPVNGSAQEKFEFITKIAALEDYTDESVGQFLPYYYQAATQLGSPDNFTAHLEPFRLFEFRIDQYTPKGIAIPYSNDAMLDVERWLKEQGNEIIFVYGQFDPWTAGEMPVSETGKSIQKYYVPKGNHGSKYVSLNQEDRAAAVATLSRWLGKSPVSGGKNKEFRLWELKNQSLEDLEFRARRHFGL